MSEPDVQHVPVPIRHYVDARFADHAREHAADHRALEAASKASDARLDGMNEWRATVGDQTSTFATRAVVDAKLDAFDSKLDALASSAQRGAILAGTAAGVLGVIGGLVLSELLR